MSEKAFAARDFDGAIYLYFCDEPPELKEDSYFDFDGGSKMVQVDIGLFWEVRPGQCREIEITYKD